MDRNLIKTSEARPTCHRGHRVNGVSAAERQVSFHSGMTSTAIRGEHRRHQGAEAFLRAQRRREVQAPSV